MKKTESKKAPETKKVIAVPVQKVDVSEHYKDLALVTAKCQAIEEITNDEEQDQAILVLGRIQKRQAEVEAAKATVLGPINIAVKALRVIFKPIEDELKFLEAMTKNTIAAYHRRQEDEQRRKTQAIEKQRIAGKISAATAERRLEEAKAAAPANTIKVAGGASITFVRKLELVIDKPEDVPDDYWVLDEAAIEKDLRKGMHVPGARMKEADEKGVAGRS